MKKGITLFAALLLLFSCNSNSRISKEMDCKKTSFQNLEIVDDVYKNFSVELPKNWKTNLYYDNSQSSIYAADTTKQLTETYLVDITLISSQLEFDANFILDYKNKLTNDNLVETSSFETPFLEKKSYYSRALGKKQGYPYEIINVFVQINERSHLHAKAEVYGDSLTNERLCKAIQLIEKTVLK